MDPYLKAENKKKLLSDYWEKCTDKQMDKQNSHLTNSIKNNGKSKSLYKPIW